MVTRRTLQFAAALAALCLLALGTSGAHAAEADDALWVVVRINGTELDTPTLIQRTAGDVLAPVEDAKTWGLPMLAIPTEALASQRGMVRLRSRPGFDAKLDEQEGRLDLTVAPWLYDTQEVSLSESRSPLRAAPLALMVDYDVYATANGRASAALETSLGTGRVSLDSTWQAGSAAGGRVQRLDSSLRISIPERMSTLTLGDAVGATMTTTRAVRFTGLQWSSDFSTQPDFLPFALPAARGVAVVPSTVDLFVNGNLVASRSVDPGPFAVHDVPVPIGTGEVELRIRDAMGREQRVTRRFLATPELLRPGLSAYSFELGALRRDYGLRGAAYGPQFAAFSLRHGLSSGTTVAVGSELLGKQGTLRVEAVQQLSAMDLVSVGVAGSTRDHAGGIAADLAWQHRSNNFEFGTELRMTDAGYVDVSRIGSQAASLSLATQLSARITRSLALSLTHALRQEDRRPMTQMLTLAASAPVAGGSVQGYVSRSNPRNGGTQLGVYYTLAVGRLSTGTGVVQDRRDTNTSLRVGRSLDRDTGWGWDAAAYSGSDPYRVLRLQSEGNRGGADLQVVSHGDATDVAGAWHGGLIVQSKQVYFAPSLGDSAAVLELPGLSNVAVYHDGQLLGRTDSRGQLVAPVLRSYEVNRFRVTTDNIPIDAWLAIDTAQVRPYSRNVYPLKFAAASAWSEFMLTMPDGKPVPAGARAEVGGEVVLVGDAGLLAAPVTAGTMLRLSWKGGECQATPMAAEMAAAMHRPTTLACQ